MRRALAAATLRAWFRDPIGVFFAFVFPLLILVPLGLAHKGESVHGGVAYIVYSTGGVTAMAVGTAALFTGAFAAHRWEQTGALDSDHSADLPARLCAEYATVMVVGVIQAALITSCGLLPEFGLRISGFWPLALPVIALAAAAFFTLGAAVGLAVTKPRGVAAVAGIVMPLMAYLSGAFHPMPLMPTAIRDLSWGLPLHYVVDEYTDTVSGRNLFGSEAAACAALAVSTALFGLLAVRPIRVRRRLPTLEG